MRTNREKAVLRPGAQADLPRLVNIYNHYVVNTHSTFDVDRFTVESRSRWFEAFAATGPYRLLVAEIAGHLVGYASSCQFKPKPAYSTSVETSIYLDPEDLGRGIGRQLYGGLIELLQQESSVHRAYGGIALPNPESVALHERLGFRRVATYHEVGFKLGRYWDVSWYEKDVA